MQRVFAPCYLSRVGQPAWPTELASGTLYLVQHSASAWAVYASQENLTTNSQSLNCLPLNHHLNDPN
ncbi:hypothetical protein BGY98DRAFT_1049011, partial [Russula aff. rugulosa BPL654]